MSAIRFVALIAVSALLPGCRPSATPADHFSAQVALSSATAVGTAPMFAVSTRGAQAAAWVSAPNGGTDGRLYVSARNGAPSEIRDPLGPIEAHGEAPPKLAYGPDGALYAIYTVGKVVPGERFPLSALRLVKSNDDGASWSEPVTVTGGSAFGSHSFHALHVAPDGTVYVSWLGKAERDFASGAPGTSRAGALPHDSAMKRMSHDSMRSMHGASHDSVMSAMGAHAGMAHESSAAWIARSTDGGRTWTSRTRVDMGEACPCCRTALATGRDGALYMAWRHVFPGSVRDIVVARSADHGASWSEPARVNADNWVFDACPHAGPALAVDSAGTLHVAWWTGKEGAAGVYYSSSADGARTFSPAVPLGVASHSRPAHVQLGVASRGRVVVAWDDGTRAVPQVILRQSSDAGAHWAAPIPLSAAGRAASFPVLGLVGDSVVVAWSDENAPAAGSSSAAPAKRDPKAPAALHQVGDAQVMMRRGSLQ